MLAFPEDVVCLYIQEDSANKVESFLFVLPVLVKCFKVELFLCHFGGSLVGVATTNNYLHLWMCPNHFNLLPYMHISKIEHELPLRITHSWSYTSTWNSWFWLREKQLPISELHRYATPYLRKMLLNAFCLTHRDRPGQFTLIAYTKSCSSEKKVCKVTQH